MTREELIKAAQLKFPKDTEFDNSNLGYDCKNTSNGEIPLDICNDNNIYVYGINGGKYTVYKNGNWATITKSIVTESTDYQIF